jgi:Domain of unknown function (DUF932)
MISTAHSPRLAARFGQNTFVIRSETPLAEDQMRRAAPSIFAEGKHGSRSERYTYIPTIDVLRGLRQEGFEPFMVAQSKSRVEGKTEFTKHMIRMRHAGQVNTRTEANEIILINSHDGASSYQMLSGLFRFVCCNGLVVGDVTNDIRIPHKGNIQDEVIEGAFRVLEDSKSVGRQFEPATSYQNPLEGYGKPATCDVAGFFLGCCVTVRCQHRCASLCVLVHDSSPGAISHSASAPPTSIVLKILCNSAGVPLRWSSDAGWTRPLAHGGIVFYSPIG